MVDLRGTSSPIHAIGNYDQPKGSWLGRAVNPFQRLRRFRSSDQTQNQQNQRKQEEEDSRLASLAAAIVLTAQPRIFAPNGITVAMIGCGRMGCDIVGELLRRGCKVRVYDMTQYTRERALQLIMATLKKHEEMGLQLQHDDYYMLERFTVHDTIGEAICGASLVLEAIIEDLNAKVNVLQKVAAALASQGVAPNDVLLATNTVSIPVNQLVSGLAQHEQALPYVTRIVGLRFLDPTWYIDNAELTLPVVEMARAKNARARAAAPLAPAVRFFFTGGSFAQHLSPEETAAMYETWSKVDCAPESTDAAIRADRLVRFLSLKPTYFVGGSRRHMTYEEAALCAARQSQQCESDNASLAGGAPDPRWADGQGPPSAPASSDGRMDDEDVQCAVCMEKPRDTLLRPCGHVAMCLTCAQRMLMHSSQPACVVCRSPIEDLLSVPNLASVPQSSVPGPAQLPGLPAGLQAEAVGEAADLMREDPQSDSQDDSNSDTQDDSSRDGGASVSSETTTARPGALNNSPQYLQPPEHSYVMPGHSLKMH